MTQYASRPSNLSPAPSRKVEITLRRKLDFLATVETDPMFSQSGGFIVSAASISSGSYNKDKRHTLPVCQQKKCMHVMREQSSTTRRLLWRVTRIYLSARLGDVFDSRDSCALRRIHLSSQLHHEVEVTSSCILPLLTSEPLGRAFLQYMSIAS